MALQIVIESGAGEGDFWVLPTEKIRIGRGRDNELVLADPTVVEHHATLHLVGSEYIVEIAREPATLDDATLARGSRHRVASGDRLQLGETVLRLTPVDALLELPGGKMIALGVRTVVGSSPRADVIVRGAAVEGQHLVIEATARGYRARGVGIAERLLESSDVLTVGDTVVRYVVKRRASLGAAIADDIDYTKTLLQTTAAGVVGELQCLSGRSRGLSVPLGDRAVSFGGDPAYDVVVTEVAKAAPQCVVAQSDGGVAVEPASGSAIAVNGRTITERTVLRPGDLLSIGKHVFHTRVHAKRDADGKTLVARGARFVIGGDVVEHRRVVIGRAATCDLAIPDDRVRLEHCEIVWDGQFQLVDRSEGHTYLDDRCVTQKGLETAHILQCGSVLIRIEIDGDVCVMERIDAVHAPAPRTAALTLQRHVRTLVERSASRKPRETAPAAPRWQASSDLSRDPRPVRVAIVAFLAACVACVIVYVADRRQALGDHPLSDAHARANIDREACGACHARLDAPATSRCEGCHRPFGPRAKHGELSCDGCHREHAPADPDRLQHAASACGRCHVAQHATDVARVNAAAGAHRINAGVLRRREPDPEAFHVRHSRVLVDGVQVGIPCTACHGDVGTDGAESATRRPGLTCYRCHAGDVTATRTCVTCHEREHQGELTRRIDGKQVPQPTRSHALLPVVLGVIFIVPLVGFVLLRRRGTPAPSEPESAERAPREYVKLKIHSINPNKCVGCRKCVEVCPGSVLDLVDHKVRVANFDSCIQCSLCEQVCAFDALRMHPFDKPAPTIDVPILDEHYETEIPGMFVIGQAAGAPQIKNAANLGRAVVQRILQQGFAPSRSGSSPYDIVIVGSGPGGLSAALTCHELGLSYVVLEKQREVAWTIRTHYADGKEVMADPRHVALESSLPHRDTTREELLAAWQRIIDTHGIKIECGRDVTDVRKEKDGSFTIDVAGHDAVHAARVILAIGSVGVPRRIGCIGDQLEQVHYALRRADDWVDKAILVVGSGDAAIEVALQLAEPQRRNSVTHAVRGALRPDVKDLNRKRHDAAISSGRITLYLETPIAEVAAGVVRLRPTARPAVEVANDVVFAMIGQDGPKPWLLKLGIKFVAKAHAIFSPDPTDVLARATSVGLPPVRRIDSTR